MALTTEQLVLINNLMYLGGSPGNPEDPMTKASYFEGHTVAEWLASIDYSLVQDDVEYGCLMTGKDWKPVLQAVMQDETLMGMTIATTHEDNLPGSGGGGYSAVFVNEGSGDAIVAFAGTAKGEWADDFYGGNVVSTPQQENALNWFQQQYDACGLDRFDLTATGHSKGGNKSKFITLMDGRVDHCVSFDGQGFSDKFMNEHASEILLRQGKIENHNLEYDYVNLLLNDVGETTYYEGQGLGPGQTQGNPSFSAFVENHAPNSFIKFSEDGSFSMIKSPGGQGPEMKALDEFLNSYLRSMPDSARTDALNMIGNLVQSMVSDNVSGVDQIIAELANSEYADDLAYLLAFSLKYQEENPVLTDALRAAFRQCGLEEWNKYADIAESILSFETTIGTPPFSIHIDFDTLMGIISGGTVLSVGVLEAISLLPGVNCDTEWALRKLSEWINEKYGIEISPDSLARLLGIFVLTNSYLDKVQIPESGEDIRYSRSRGASGHHLSCPIVCDAVALQQQTLMREAADILGRVSEILSIEMEAPQINAMITGTVTYHIRKKKLLLDQLQRSAALLADMLGELSRLYEKTENEQTVLKIK